MMGASEVTLYRQKDAWLSIIICYFIQIAVGFFLIPLLHKIFPSLSRITLNFCLPVLSVLIPATYLGFRYGWIRLSDFLLRGSDYLVLLAAISILFVRFSLVPSQSPHGASTLYGQTMSQLPPFEYFLALFALLIYGPLLEELLLRKYVFEIFRNNYSVFWAVIFTSFCGTILHIDFENDTYALIKIFVYSLFYTVVYLKSRLGGSFFIHGLANLFIYVTWLR
jgi:membrane protease YdiL (CAAX protease family)